MTENFAFSLEELFERICEEGLAAGVMSEEGFHSLVEDSIQDMIDHGEIDPDQNTEQYETTLKSRWPEYEARLVD